MRAIEGLPADFDELVAPAGEDLRGRIRSRTRARVESLRRRLERAGSRTPRWRRFEAILASAADVPGGGPFRCWLSAAEDAVLLAETALTARRDGAAGRSRLVEAALDAGLLADLAPGGSIPRDFESRCVRRAREILDRLAAEAPLLLAPWVGGRRRVRIPFAADPDVGRPEDELEIPEAGVRFVRAGRERALDLRFPTATPPIPREHRSLSVGAVLLSEGVADRVGPRDPGFERRVDRALDLLERVWPRAAETVLAYAWRVVPVTDRGTVSYSSARRPGILYIHVRSAPLLRLAEDLLHETVHVRVHHLEEVAAITVPRGPDGSEARFWSPWRKEWRPVRGLLHGATTFTAGAEFFERTLRAGEEGAVRLPATRRFWLARRLLEERESVGVALRLLDRARGEGLLTPAGRRILETVRRAHGAISGAAARRKRELARTAEGREHLARFVSFRLEMKGRPLRWS